MNMLNDLARNNSQLPMNVFLITITLTLTMVSPSLAASINLSGLTFSESSPGFRITGGDSGLGTKDDPIIVNKIIEQFNDNNSLTNPGGSSPTTIMSIEGLGSFGRAPGIKHENGFFLREIITNSTNETWNSFELELQEELSVGSPDTDGLSFAQGFEKSNRDRVIGSDKYGSFNEQFRLRDGVRFFSGSVAPGETVVFDFAITDNSPETLNQDSFILLHSANTAAYSPPDDPTSISSSSPLAPVPEPVSLLTSLAALGMATLLKRGHSRHQEE